MLGLHVTQKALQYFFIAFFFSFLSVFLNGLVNVFLSIITQEARDHYRTNFIGQCTAQKMKFSIKDFFRKCDQIRRKLRIWSHLLKKSSMENFIFCAVM